MRGDGHENGAKLVQKVLSVLATITAPFPSPRKKSELPIEIKTFVSLWFISPLTFASCLWRSLGNVCHMLMSLCQDFRQDPRSLRTVSSTFASDSLVLLRFYIFDIYWQVVCWKLLKNIPSGKVGSSFQLIVLLRSPGLGLKKHLRTLSSLNSTKLRVNMK